MFIAIVIAIVFSALVLITGKGDAMSGGGSVRTTFKGKASFDDYMSKLTLILGVSFFCLMLLIDGISNRMSREADSKSSAPAASSSTKK
jgi:preprotein translocase subunit SecG